MKLFYVITVIFFLTTTNWALAQNVTSDNQAKTSFVTNHIQEANIIEYNPSTDNHKFMTGVNIEIFNNTTNAEELVLKNHNQHRFSFNFKRGNSYTVMLRKEGYLIKRINIKLGVDDCVSCFEGLNMLTPSQQDFASGSLNLQMRKINDGDRVIIPEIQFQGKSTTLTTEGQRALADLAMILRDNSNIISEIEVHTDSRGSTETNKQLSEDRAEIIAKFLIAQNVSENDIFVKGYGESRIINECTDGVNCPEDKHAVNSRAVFKFHTSIGENKIFSRSLSSILLTENKMPLANNSNTARNGQNTDRKLDVFDTPAQNNNETIKEEAKPIQVAEKTTAENNVYPKVVDVTAKKPKIADATVKDEVFSAPSETNGIQKVSNAINNVTINASDVTKICVYNKYIPFQSIEEEEGPGLNQIREPIGSVDLNTKGEISKEGTIVYGTDGNRVMNRSGRAILVDATYSGFKVELFTSEAELPNSNIIFEKYGKVYLDDNGASFSYMIGHFVQKKSADDFLTNVVLPKYPNAQVIKYKEGKRKDKE